MDGMNSARTAFAPAAGDSTAPSKRAGKIGKAFSVGLLAIAACAWSAGAGAQTFTEFPIPTTNSHPLGVTVGPDGALWFIEANANQIGRITTAGAITEFSVPSTGDTCSQGPYGITAGPDDNLWFVEGDANKIGRLTPAGAITEYPIPGGNCPIDITIGPDGNLWFTNFGGGIGRITTAGAITQYTIPAAPGSAPFPNGITTGPDGALWFTEFVGNMIGRITTSGTITQFPLLTPNSIPGDITAGPDGALWFTDDGGIGRITTSGTITAISIPAAASGFPSGITTGPDGALWFINPGSNNIIRVTTAGAITQFPIPTGGSGPFGITQGPDGAVWFTEYSANKIGRLVPPSSPSPLLSAVLPDSRSAQVGATVTAFATIINTGAAAASGCSIAPAGLPITFLYQTTDPATNALTGSPNTPVNIAGGASQSFVIAFTPGTAITPTNVALIFSCSNAAPAPITAGLNTLLLSASTTPTPDVIALGATLQNDGIVHVTNGSPPTGVFAVATDNLGSGDTITVATNTGTATLPITVTLCQTNPATGACLQTPSATVATTIGSSATPTFGIFVSASGTVPFDPANDRIFVTFTDSTNAIRGETSVAVETQ